MLNRLKVIHNKAPTKGPELIGYDAGFYLKTCQREILIIDKNNIKKPYPISGDEFNGQEGYAFLLETICGLQSDLVGETEITRQFKDTYSCYLLSPYKNKFIISILERIFQDSKKIRTEFLNEICQESYAGLTKKIIRSLNITAPVLIFGSGKLTYDLSMLLNKHYPVHVCARDIEQLQKIEREFKVGTFDIGSQHLALMFPVLINTISSNQKVLNIDLVAWQQKNHRGVIIDLADQEQFNRYELANLKIPFYDLRDILKSKDQISLEKQVLIGNVKKQIKELSSRRTMLLNQKNYHGAFCAQ